MSQADSAYTPNSSRRLFLGAGSAAVVFGALTVAAQAEKRPDAVLIYWVARLETCHQARELWEAKEVAPDEVEAFEAACDEHWALRERIDQIGATTLDGLKAKAKAAHIAFRLDPDTDCGVAGSYRSLTLSLMRDIQALNSKTVDA